VLGGIGIAYFLGANPLLGALAAALASAAVIGMVSLHAGQHEDTTIGALWALGMAIGIVFMYKTPGYQQDLMSYLFGNILLVTSTDAYLVAALDAAILLVVLLFYKRFQALCFDEEFTLIQGVRVDVFYLLLLGLTALTVVILVQVVGIILVIALLTLPAATAGHYAGSLRQMMLLALVVGAVCTLGGLSLSYPYNLPPGATIVLISGGIYLLSTAFSRLVLRGLRAGARKGSPS
jgi:zinc transport system permease protein